MRGDFPARGAGAEHVIAAARPEVDAARIGRRDYPVAHLGGDVTGTMYARPVEQVGPPIGAETEQRCARVRIIEPPGADDLERTETGGAQRPGRDPCELRAGCTRCDPRTAHSLI